MGSGLNIAGTDLALSLAFFGVPAAIDSAGFLLRVSVSIFKVIAGVGAPPGPGPGGGCDGPTSGAGLFLIAGFTVG